MDDIQRHEQQNPNNNTCTNSQQKQYYKKNQSPENIENRGSYKKYNKKN